MTFAAEINDAIAAGRTVTAEHADLHRTGQPHPGQIVTLQTAFDDGRGGIRATAVGYRGRFGVTNVRIVGESEDDGRDQFETY